MGTPHGGIELSFVPDFLEDLATEAGAVPTVDYRWLSETTDLDDP